MPNLIASPAVAARRPAWLARIRDSAASPLQPSLRRLRNVAAFLVALVALYAILGFLIFPPIAREKLETELTQNLGRRATLGKVEFNPFTLRARLSDFALGDGDAGTLLSFDALELDVSSASIRYLAPVFDAGRLVRPKIRVVRNKDGAYDIQDLVERATAKPDTTRPSPQFSLNNIEIEDGTLSLDDRPYGRTLSASNIAIGVPFLSNLAHDAKIRVTPRLDGAVDGARFSLKGNSTTPFADVQEATLDFDLDQMALARYAEYWPLPGGIKLVDGVFTSRLAVAFTTEKGTPRTVTVAGTARLDRPAFARRDGSPLTSADSLEVAVSRIDPIARVAALDRVAIQGLRLDVRRASDGSFELERLLSASRGTPSKTPETGAWRFSIADASVGRGTVQVTDEAVSPVFKVMLGSFSLNGKRIDSNATGSFDVTFDTDSGARFEGRADANLAAASARGEFKLTDFRLDKLYPYYANALNIDVRRGKLDVSAAFDVGTGKDTMDVKLADGNATLADVEMALPGERDPLWRIPRARLSGIACDLQKRTITIEQVDGPDVAIRVVRESNGSVEFERIVKSSASDRKSNAPAAVSADPDWSYAIRTLTFDRIAAAFEDRVPKPPVKLRIDAKVRANDFGNARGSKGTIDVAARLPPAGRVRATGALATNPVALDWRIDVSGVNLVALRPYYEAQTNVIVTRGTGAAKGRLVYAASAGFPSRLSYAGDVTISDFASLDRPTSQELLRWKTLSLTGLDTVVTPQKLAIGAIALDQYYARLIVNPDGTLNLQQLLASESPPPSPPARTSPAVTTSARTSTRQLPEPAGDRELPVSIGRISVNGGEVELSDFFVKPNYSAHLTGVSGTVSALSAMQAGQVELNARVENTAPVEIRGTVNPFARELALDLVAKATDIDLPPLTPYSGKYAGYGIQKGKLSFEVHYAIDQRKLAATNKLVLDQLTFGERIDSPTATKLPVLLAVALLKDRNGVINLDLPIQGTLDDPQFSVWRIVVQIIGNLITKIVTAPFAVLSALAGGGGEQLSYVEFAPGRADLSEAGETKLRSLAKALGDRPALKLDATGRAVPDIDRDGLKRTALERAVRAQKQKTLATQGESVDSVSIAPDEYPKYLKAVYKDTKLADKPRNVLGFEKDIPPADMEALLLASYGADETALRELANRRAQAVKDWLVGQGNIASERVFVVAPKLTNAGIEDKGAATRVDFSIK